MKRCESPTFGEGLVALAAVLHGGGRVLDGAAFLGDALLEVPALLLEATGLLLLLRELLLHSLPLARLLVEVLA